MSDILIVDDRPNEHPEVRKKLKEMWENTPEEEKEVVRKLQHLFSNSLAHGN